MKCPKCGKEYKDEVTHCPHCGRANPDVFVGGGRPHPTKKGRFGRAEGSFKHKMKKRKEQR